MITAKQFVENAKKYLGYKYIYAAKGGKYTVEQIKSFAKQYPKMYTANYLARTIKNANQLATDCSGLIYLASNKAYLLGSTGLFDRTNLKGEIVPVDEAPAGAVTYKPGHVAIKISDLEHIESRGVDYGVVIKTLSSQSWKCALLLDYIDYTPNVIIKTSCKWDIKWLQKHLNEQIKVDRIKCEELIVDGEYGNKTANAVRLWQKYKKWTVGSGFYVGNNTVKSLK